MTPRYDRAKLRWRIERERAAIPPQAPGGAKRLAYPRVPDPEAPSIRPERPLKLNRDHPTTDHGCARLNPHALPMLAKQSDQDDAFSCVARGSQAASSIGRATIASRDPPSSIPIARPGASQPSSDTPRICSRHRPETSNIFGLLVSLSCCLPKPATPGSSTRRINSPQGWPATATPNPSTSKKTILPSFEAWLHFAPIGASGLDISPALLGGAKSFLRNIRPGGIQPRLTQDNPSDFARR